MRRDPRYPSLHIVSRTPKGRGSGNLGTDAPPGGKVHTHENKAGSADGAMGEKSKGAYRNQQSCFMTVPITQRILAIGVNWQGFGFVEFDGPFEIVDWGMRNFRNGVNAVKIPLEAKVRYLLKTQPDVLVLMKPTTPKRKRTVARIGRVAQECRIPVAFLSDTDVRAAFVPKNQNKYQIAAAIAAQYPELQHRLPSPRKRWESEKYGITLFEAAAIGLVYYRREQPPTA